MGNTAADIAALSAVPGSGSAPIPNILGAVPLRVQGRSDRESVRVHLATHSSTQPSPRLGLRTSNRLPLQSHTHSAWQSGTLLVQAFHTCPQSHPTPLRAGQLLNAQGLKSLINQPRTARLGHNSTSPVSKRSIPSELRRHLLTRRDRTSQFPLRSNPLLDASLESVSSRHC